MKRMESLYRNLVLVIIVIFLGGCTTSTFYGLKPIYPSTGLPTNFKGVDSLQPELQWQSASGQNLQYDLIIWETTWGGVISSKVGKPLYLQKGRVVYYKESIQGNSHKIDVTLEPDTYYFWSVRTRTENTLSDWSTYEYKRTLFWLIGGHTVECHNSPFRFKTPKKSIDSLSGKK